MTNTTLAERICIAYQQLFNIRASQTLSTSSIKSLEELGSILRPIYRRMKKEGWVLKDGKMVNEHD
jgi:hypothetical protein